MTAQDLAKLGHKDFTRLPDKINPPDIHLIFR
jgi:hypothetical protein